MLQCLVCGREIFSNPISCGGGEYIHQECYKDYFETVSYNWEGKEELIDEEDFNG